MRLTEAGPGPIPTPPLALFKEHLRLGFGFADDGAEDALLEGQLRAAVRTVERRTARALVARDFVLQVRGPDGGGGLALPVGPATAVVSAAVRDGAVTTMLDVADWRISPGGTGQRLSRPGAGLPVPRGGALLEVVFTAGLAAAWSGVPEDLAQAVLVLAADLHTRRGAEEAASLRTGLPETVAALVDSWRPARL